MRRRVLAPELWNDGKVLKLRSDLATLLWIGIIASTDDEGIIELDADVLKSSLNIKAPVENVEQCLSLMTERGMLVPYQHDGQTFAFLPRFYRHQTLDRPSPSKHSRPPDAILCQHEAYVAARNAAFASNRSRHKDEFSPRPEPVQDESRTCPAETKRNETKRNEQDSPAPPAAEAVPPVFTFAAEQVVGKGSGPWHVTPELHKTLCDAYPSVDIPAEYRKMLAWLVSKPSGRKTRKGMPRFLNSWLARVQNAGGAKDARRPDTQQRWGEFSGGKPNGA